MTDSGAAGATARAVAPDRVVDPRLLERAANGDVDAFDEVLRPRLRRMYRMALAITRSEADANDAVQDASVSAWRQLPRLRADDRFDSWLDQILVNACRSLLRRSRRIQVREIDIAGARPDDAGGPLQSATGVDLSEADLVRRAFERLDADTRALLVLHYVEDRPLAEIGQLTGSPLGTVKWRIHNARRALDQALEVERR